MEVKSLLDKVGEFDVVAVHNPLSSDFEGTVARSVPVALKRTELDNYAREKYGVELVNPQNSPMEHVLQKITIKSGHTLRVPGPVAKVIVRQLIKQMIQLEGRTREMANPNVLREYEERVIMNQESMIDNITTESAEERLDRQISDMNKEELNEPGWNEVEETNPGSSPAGETEKPASEGNSESKSSQTITARIPKAASK